MNTDIFELEYPDFDIAMDITLPGFREFCEAIDTLDKFELTIPIELYTEEVNSGSMTLRNAIKTATKNTTQTTLDVGGIYGNITDSEAGVIKGFWDLFMRALNLSIKIVSFVLDKLTYVPRLILNVSNKVADIPSDVKNKIAGNIKLYITCNDIQNLYNNQLLSQLSTFIGLSQRLSQGDTWGTFFNPRKNGKKKIKGENDIKICKDMAVIYRQLSKLEFKPSTIYIGETKDAVNQYFGTEKSISFTDLNGKHHTSNYYEAISQLVEDIKKHESQLKDVQQVISAKYSTTQMNSNFSRLNVTAREIITNGIQMTSKMLTITGNIVKYVMTDMKTIENATNTILKSSGINTK